VASKRNTKLQELTYLCQKVSGTLVALPPIFFFFFLKKRLRATFRGSDRLEQNIVQWHESIVPFNCFARDLLMFCEIKRLSLIISLVTSVLSPLIAVTR
jgi:hypothetical protein